MKILSVVSLLILALGLTACGKRETYAVYVLKVERPAKSIVDEIMNGNSQEVASVGAVRFEKIQGMNMISDSVCRMADGITDEHTDKVDHAAAGIVKLFNDNKPGSYIYAGSQNYTETLILVINSSIYNKFVKQCHSVAK